MGKEKQKMIRVFLAFVLVSCATLADPPKPIPPNSPAVANMHPEAQVPQPPPPVIPPVRITPASCWVSSCLARLEAGRMRVEASCKVGEPRTVPIANPNDALLDGIILCLCCPAVQTAKEMKQ